MVTSPSRIAFEQSSAESLARQIAAEQMPPEQRSANAAFLRASQVIDRPRTPEQLLDWFRRLGFWIAHRPVIEGMDSPMMAFWYAYSGQVPTIILEGARGSGKTRGMSLVELSKARFFPGINLSHIGGTRAQAQRCYTYVQEFVSGGKELAFDITRTRLSDTLWTNGSHLEVLPATVNAVSGGHPQYMVLDEFDLIPWEVFQQAVGMPQSNDTYAAIIVLTSALYRSDGTMSALLNAETPPRTMRWSVIDSMEPCDGHEGRPVCLDAIAVANGGAVANPPRCALWNNGCEGKAVRATGHKKRHDVLTELALTDDYTWMTQYLSKDAARRGLMYEHFEWTESDDGTTNVTQAAEYRDDLEVYWGADDGYEDANVCLLGQVLPNGDISIFDEVYVNHMEHEEVLNIVHQPDGLDDKSEQSWFLRLPDQKARGPYKKPRRVFIDPSAKQLQKTYARRLRSGARVRWQGARIMDGVSVVRRYVRNFEGKRRLIIHPRCINLIREMRYWRAEQVSPGVWLDEPEDNNGNNNPDHACDSLRYLIEHIAGRVRPGVA